MQYLHNGGVVHGDLKSSNVLVDESLAVKITDYGLSVLQPVGPQSAVPNVCWAAPEVIAATHPKREAKSDVFSFAIVAWELATRKIPHKGMNPHHVRQQVVLLQMRPRLEVSLSPAYKNLLEECCARPEFQSIVSNWPTFLANMESAIVDDENDNATSVQAPTGLVTFVITGIESEQALWDWNPDVMSKIAVTHNELLRSCCRKHGGYEVTEDGSGFVLAFHSSVKALQFCCESQLALHSIRWEAILEGGASSLEEAKAPCGFLVKMGLHEGRPEVTISATRSTMEYRGPCVRAAFTMVDLSSGGHIVVSNAARASIEKSRVMDSQGVFQAIGSAMIGQKQEPVHESSLMVESFGSTSSSQKNNSTSEDPVSILERIQRHVRPPWAVDPAEVEISSVILGRGNYGTVTKATYRGQSVAVKRFFTQQVTQKTLNEIQKQLNEMLLLAKLRHPSVVQFLGACIEPQNMFIITEWMDLGSLTSVLKSRQVQYAEAVGILLSVSDGMIYLHKSNVVHRDLKAANILINTRGEVKLSDFGLAAVKKATRTMTLCGTAAWMAPEVLSRSHYSEQSDVYSFGVVMLEVMTRHPPFHGVAPMDIVYKITQGERPEIPARRTGYSDEFVELIRCCWGAEPDSRPLFAQISERLRAMQEYKE
eukprot:m51a1_g8787 putative serine threonine kinase (652) ;mRNA; f:218367-220984